MQKLLSIVMSATLALVANSTALGQKVGGAEESFKKADRDRDGKLTLDEYKDAHEGKNAHKVKRFKTLDEDGDGFVTLEEFKGGFAK